MNVRYTTTIVAPFAVVWLTVVVRADASSAAAAPENLLSNASFEEAADAARPDGAARPTGSTGMDEPTRTRPSG